MPRATKKARTSLISKQPPIQTISQSADESDPESIDQSMNDESMNNSDDESNDQSNDQSDEQTYEHVEKVSSYVTAAEALTPILDNPAQFYAIDHSLYKELATISQSIYQATKKSNSGSLTAAQRSSLLNDLLIDQLNAEQIYSQLQLLHEPVIRVARARINKLINITPEQLGLSLVAQSTDEADDQSNEDDEDAEMNDEQIDDDDDADLEARIDALGDEDEEDDGEQLDEEDADDQDGEQFENEQDDEEQSDNDDDEQPKKKSSKSSESRDITEDAFFNLKDMDRFADYFEAVDSGLEPPQKPKAKRKRDEEDEEDDESEEFEEEVFGDVDLNEDVGDIDIAEGEKYDDFFDEPTEEDLHGQSIADMHHEEDEDDEEMEDEDMMNDEDDEAVQADKNADHDDEFSGYFARLSATQREAQTKKAEEAELAKLSKFERERRLAAPAMAELERRLVDPKTWSQRGEITAIDRPKDSLLDAEVEIEYAGKPTETMAASVNQSIEDVIKKRVESQQFDDPKRKAPSKPRQQRVRDDVEVSAEKNEMGLGEIYAQAYLESQATVNAAIDANGNPSAVKTKAMQELELAHKEIHSIFIGLCSELDALSQYEFTPVHRVDMKIVRNEASGDLLQREEVGLDFEQTGLSMAAHEVAHGKAVKQRDMTGEAEKSSEERQRQRRARKAASRSKKSSKADDQAMTQLSAVDQAIAAKQAKTSAKAGELQGKWTSAQLQAATTARNVKRGTTSSADGAKSQPKSSKQFFAQLQATVSQVEQDAKKQGFKL